MLNYFLKFWNFLQLHLSQFLTVLKISKKYTIINAPLMKVRQCGGMAVNLKWKSIELKRICSFACCWLMCKPEPSQVTYISLPQHSSIAACLMPAGKRDSFQKTWILQTNCLATKKRSISRSPCSARTPVDENTNLNALAHIICVAFRQLSCYKSDLIMAWRISELLWQDIRP